MVNDLTFYNISIYNYTYLRYNAVIIDISANKMNYGKQYAIDEKKNNNQKMVVYTIKNRKL